MPPIQPVYITTNHLLHLVLTLVTCGIWALVWPCVYAVNTMNNTAKRQQFEEQMRDYQQRLWMYHQGQ